MASERTVDALVLGGGPAGCTAACLLARAGIETVVLEAEPGAAVPFAEALLPHTIPLLDELGVRAEVLALPHTLRREGTGFFTGDGSARVTYWFDQALPPAIGDGFQVRRDELSAALREHARREGACVLSEWKAVAPLWDGERLVGAAARDAAGEGAALRARVTLDATGRSSFLATQMGWRFPSGRRRRNAFVASFRGVWQAPGREAGNTAAVLVPGGWFWHVPLADGSASVALALDAERARQLGRTPEAQFAAAVAATPEVARRLRHAERVGTIVSYPDFSYRVMHRAGDGFCLLGDAVGFVGGALASGVLVALATAACAAEDVTDALRRHARVDASDFGPTVDLTRMLQRVFSSVARALVDPHFLALLFSPTPVLRLPEAITSLLAGDVLRPGRWRRTGRYRLARVLAKVQGWGDRWGRPLVPPLPTAPP